MSMPGHDTKVTANGYRITHDFSGNFNDAKLPLKLDCIVHAAASNEKSLQSQEIFKINTNSTRDLLGYAKKIGIKAFVFISSGAVYGYRDAVLTENAAVNPPDSYALSKHKAELLVEYYSRYFSTVNLRLFFPYGPGQTKGIIPKLIIRIKQRKHIIIYNEGNSKIALTYIDDVIDIIEKALLLQGKYTLNVCGDEIINIKELSLLLGHYLNLEPSFVYKKDKTISNLIGDNSEMKRILNIVPKVSLEQGIKNYFNNLRT